MLQRGPTDSSRSHDGGSGLITPREQEVAALIAQGLSNQQIAERLVLTPGTVANHVANILRKLGARSRVEVAVKIARDQGRSDAETILGLLETLREVDSGTAREAMEHATTVLATTFGADKVDAFFYDAATNLLIAFGTSQTPLGQRQHELGLDRLPLSNGGRAAWVFRAKARLPRRTRRAGRAGTRGGVARSRGSLDAGGPDPGRGGPAGGAAGLVHSAGALQRGPAAPAAVRGVLDRPRGAGSALGRCSRHAPRPLSRRTGAT